MKNTPTIQLRTAHDVRKLCLCGSCGGLGDKRFMPDIDGKPIHGFCALALIGIDGLVTLPKDQRSKLTLGEIGQEAMRELLDRMEDG